MLRPSRMILWIIVLGAALRIYGLGTESLWLDEASTARRMGMSFADLSSDAGVGVHLPLYFWISEIWCGIAGTSEFALRFPAMVFGVLGILMVYYLGCRLFTPAAGRWGAFFTAINPYLIHYSQEARPYTLFMFLALASWYYMLRLYKDASAGNVAGYAVSTTAALYSHPFGPMIVLSHAAGLLIFRRVRGYRITHHTLRPLLAAFGIPLLLYLPMVFRMFEQFMLKTTGESATSWIPTPGIIELFGASVRYFMDPKLGFAVLIIVTLAGLFRISVDRKAWPSVMFCFSIWISFILIPWLVSITVTPLFVVRYTIPVLPIILIILGWAIAGFEMLPRRIIITLLLILTVMPLYSYYTKMDKSPWRQAIDSLSGKLISGDVVVWDPGYHDQIAKYYFSPPGGVGNLFVRRDTDVAKELSGAERLWLVLGGRGKYNTKDLLDSPESGWKIADHRVINESFAQDPYAVNIADITIDLYEKSPVLQEQNSMIGPARADSL
jgi:mannosyltransferase